MKVIVCGGRDFNNAAYLTGAMDMLHLVYGVSLLAHGAARGADTLAGKWAKKRAIECVEYPADWDKHGNGAGPIRNRWMLEDFKPDMVVGFPGGRGTEHMLEIAQEVPTVIVMDITKAF